MSGTACTVRLSASQNGLSAFKSASIKTVHRSSKLFLTGLLGQPPHQAATMKMVGCIRAFRGLPDKSTRI
jgi:hypothetical protein